MEVRYRSNSRWGDGLASITAGKQKRLIRAAASWLKQNPRFSDRRCRFDVISISGPVSTPTLKWVRAAFGAR